MFPPLETVLCHYTRTQGKLAQQLHVPRLVYMSSILKDDPAHQWKNASSVIKSRIDHIVESCSFSRQIWWNILSALGTDDS
jgi:glucan phosphoethanolaminetransferase (alkaline phosphatase superfamily)